MWFPLKPKIKKALHRHDLYKVRVRLPFGRKPPPQEEPPPDEELPQETVEKIRDSFLAFWLERMVYEIETGRWDENIRGFMRGDSLHVDLNLKLLPNDMLVFRALVGLPPGPKVMERVRRFWERSESLNGFDMEVRQ
jgi:hypothetical protein